MADFDHAVEVVLSNEGGYVNNPADPGGETNFGISKRQYPDLDIRNLTRDQAKDIYFRDYWTPHNFTMLVSQTVATKVFDAAVNMGPVAAIRMLQDTLNYFLVGPIIADGKIGQFTASAASQVSDEKVLPELRARLAKHHVDMNLPEFLMGWLRRDCQ
jgi:lysozyme family protein